MPDEGSVGVSKEHRTPRRGLLVAVAIFTTTATVFTLPGLLPGRTMGGVDVWAYSTPFRETTPTAVEINNPLQTDQLEQIPLVAEFWSSVRQGELQLWEPDHAAGMPLLTAVHTRVLAPPNLAYLAVPLHMGAAASVWLTLVLAQLGAFVLARRWGLGWWGAVLAGVAYGFSGPVTSLLLRIHETAMLPWMLAGIHACMHAPRRRDMLLTAAATAGTLLSGFPAATLHVLYVSVAYVSFLAVRAWRGGGLRTAARRTTKVAWAGAAGALLTAPVLLPTAEWLPLTGSMERSYEVTHALGIDRLATAVSGRFFGAYQDNDFWLPDSALANPVEASMTMGLVALLGLAWLAMRGSSSSKRSPSLSRFLVPTGTIVLVAVVLGGPALGLVHQLPFMASNAFGRARFVVALLVALLAGTALDDVLARRDRQDGGHEADQWVRWGAAIVIVMVGIGTYQAFGLAIEIDQVQELALDLAVPLSSALVVGVAVLMHGKQLLGGAARTTLGLTAVVALAVELQVGAWGFVSTTSRDLFYPDPQLPEQVEGDLTEGGLYRFAGTTLNVLPPHAAGLMDLTDLRVSFPAFEPWREVLATADPAVFERRRLRTIFSNQVDWASPTLDRLATRYVTHPLRDPLLETRVAVGSTELDGPNVREWTLPEFAAPLRAVAIEASTDDCDRGWIELTVDGEVVSRRLAREVSDPTLFPVADLEAPGSRAALRGTNCPLELLTTTIRYHLADGPMTVVSTDGLVIYERPEARPRVDLVADVRRVAPDDLHDLLATTHADIVLVTDPVDVDHEASGTATLVEDGPDEVVVQTRASGAMLLVLRDVAAPGWHAIVDRHPADIVTVDGTLRGVELEAGSHTVTFRYAPRSLQVGTYLAGAGAVLGAAMLWRRRRP